ncbi:serine hydrolase domain-containing protein [Marinicrinis lubricantis]|uniref:Serine hydrolase domain-containing protein n=1 Tax=Marinicrinis lubricantis TaxID=2086470 RepID=A0ABW1ITW7_9BACL
MAKVILRPKRDHWPTKEWVKGDPSDFQIPLEIASELNGRIPEQYPKMYALLIVHRGHLIYESYWGGMASDDVMDMRSATKSVTSAVIGTLEQRGIITDVELPLEAWLDAELKEIYARNPDPQEEREKRMTTLRHLLTMTSGFSWETGKKFGEKWIHHLHRSPHWVRYILQRPIDPGMREKFQYRSTDSHLLSVLISRLTGKSASEWAGPHLFHKLGIRHYEWLSDPQGHSQGHVGLSMRSRDMAKLGWLYLNQGYWDGEQLLAEQWVDDSWKEQAEGTDFHGTYGFQWWNKKLNGSMVHYALGHGGQYIFAVPDKDMVVVMTSDPKVSRWKNPRTLLEQVIIPAVPDVK